MLEINNVYCGDCLDVMEDIGDGSIDMVLADPPYGITACKWDSVIPFELMWKHLKRIIKDNGAIVLFGSQPFTSALVMSNISNFRHEWIYKKKCASNFVQAKYAPMKEHESVLVFSNQKANYYPIKEERTGGGYQRSKYLYSEKVRYGKFLNEVKGKFNIRSDELRYPSSVREFNNRSKGDRGLHPTQKPVALMEYLIKTYTNEGELVLDFCAGSGTTGVAAKNLNRNFILIEKEEEYCNIARRRIAGEIICKEKKEEKEENTGQLSLFD